MSEFFDKYFACNGPCEEINRLISAPNPFSALTQQVINCLPEPAPFPCELISYCLTGISGSDIYVTGFTYNNANTFTLFRNDGVDLSTTINTMSGLTVTGNTYLLNVTGTSFYTDYIDFNNNLSPLPSDLEGRMYWDEDNGTVTLGMHGGQVLQQIGLEQYYYVKNQSGTTIENGKVVRAAGTLGASGRILGEYMIADGTIPAKYTLGIATEDIINGDDEFYVDINRFNYFLDTNTDRYNFIVLLGCADELKQLTKFLEKSYLKAYKTALNKEYIRQYNNEIEKAFGKPIDNITVSKTSVEKVDSFYKNLKKTVDAEIYDVTNLVYNLFIDMAIYNTDIYSGNFINIYRREVGVNCPYVDAPDDDVLDYYNEYFDEHIYD